jgi:hypothetical protein
LKLNGAGINVENEIFNQVNFGGMANFDDKKRWPQIL